jgi:hypothetical protein
VCIAFEKKAIKITLPDGKVLDGTAFQTTPLDIAKSLSNSLPDKVVVAKVKYSSRVGTLDEGLFDPNEFSDDKGEAW